MINQTNACFSRYVSYSNLLLVRYLGFVYHSFFSVGVQPGKFGGKKRKAKRGDYREKADYIARDPPIYVAEGRSEEDR